MKLNDKANWEIYYNGIARVPLKNWTCILTDAEYDRINMDKIPKGNIIGIARFDVVRGKDWQKFRNVAFIAKTPIKFKLRIDRILTLRSVVVEIKEGVRMLCRVGTYPSFDCIDSELPDMCVSSVAFQPGNYDFTIDAFEIKVG
jgi:hypothetical protein